MADAFNPMEGLSEEDKAWLAAREKAKARQSAAHEDVPFVGETEADAERRKAAEAHRRATMEAAGMTPAEIAAQAAAAPPGAASVAVSSIPNMFSVLKARPEGGIKELPAGEEQYAPDWKSLKSLIAKLDGTWIVERYEFHGHVAHILGFFGKPGWEEPTDAKKEEFEVIVKDGRVFRTDPE